MERNNCCLPHTSCTVEVPTPLQPNLYHFYLNILLPCCSCLGSCPTFHYTNLLKCYLGLVVVLTSEFKEKTLHYDNRSKTD
ncbi:hypothetical protein CHARACLAT_030351 [Characodon lateralis]|uniref:Uncharacterized protein n=1 Tax=Characodon lateralis TaxID=208331 RepID=A0ABU7F0K0_9TELE|nr:hypothetical protein [Characodon lateralis]